jgi:hypothetical protein
MPSRIKLGCIRKKYMETRGIEGLSHAKRAVYHRSYVPEDGNFLTWYLLIQVTLNPHTIISFYESSCSLEHIILLFL